MNPASSILYRSSEQAAGCSGNCVVRRQSRFRTAPRLWTAYLAAALLVLLASGSTRADEAAPEIEVSVSAEDIFIGETIDYQVEIKNVENPAAPDVSALKELFTVVPNGNQSRNQSSTFIINGRVSQQSVLSHVYLYRLTPKSAGNLTIPSVKVTMAATEITSRTIGLRVQDAEKQDLVLVEIEPDRTTVYPTQPFSITINILIQPLPESGEDPLQPLRRQPPHLQINWLEVPEGLSANETSEWLQPLMSESGSGFTINEVSASTGSIFGGSRAAVFDLSKVQETRNGLDGTPIKYFTYQLTREFTPEKTGEYSFGPALVKGTFVGGVKGKEYLGRRLVAMSPAVSVAVREVPSPRPATYTGGVGDYLVAASASPVKLRVGDPLTLTLEFARGAQAGSLALIAAPDLTTIPEIAENFDIIDKAPTGRVEGDLKKFAYAMRPKRPGVTLPSMTLTTFDPTAESFTEIQTEPISLEVTEAATLSGGELVGAVAATTGNEIKKSTAGIFQNITDPAEVRDERISLSGWLTAVGGFWFVSLGSVAIVTLYRRRSTDTVGQRRSNARRTALSKLTAATQMQTHGQTKESMRQILAAFVGLVADLNNRVAEGLTAADVERALVDGEVPAADRTAIVELLELIEGAEYGGFDSINVEDSIRLATSLIARVSPLLERSVRR